MYRSSYVLIPWIISYWILSYKLDRFDETFPQRCNIEFLDNVLDNNDLSDNINPKCAADFDLKKKWYFLLPTDSSSLQRQLWVFSLSINLLKLFHVENLPGLTPFARKFWVFVWLVIQTGLVLPRQHSINVWQVELWRDQDMILGTLHVLPTKRVQSGVFITGVIAAVTYYSSHAQQHCQQVDTCKSKAPQWFHSVSITWRSFHSDLRTPK